MSGTSGAATARDTAAAAIDKYSANLGSYPYSRFVVAQSPRPSSGNEYSGIVFLGSTGLANKTVVAHETAHQWWYGMVGNNQMDQPWLDEAFAEFTSRYFFGRAMPSYCSSLDVDSSIYTFPNQPAPTTSADCGSYDQTIYFKGSNFLNGLRTKMGTTVFLNALRAIVSENRGRVVTTSMVRSTFLRFSSDPTIVGAYIDNYLS